MARFDNKTTYWFTRSLNNVINDMSICNGGSVLKATMELEDTDYPKKSDQTWGNINGRLHPPEKLSNNERDVLHARPMFRPTDTNGHNPTEYETLNDERDNAPERDRYWNIADFEE